MKTCWFCNQPIKGKPEYHHILPKRYWPRGSDHRVNNLAPSHAACHHRYHRRLDDPSLSRDEYCDKFGPSLGEGVFAR